MVFLPLLDCYLTATYAGCKNVDANPDVFTACSETSTQVRTMKGTSMIDTDGDEHLGQTQSSR